MEEIEVKYIAWENWLGIKNAWIWVVQAFVRWLRDEKEFEVLTSIPVLAGRSDGLAARALLTLDTKFTRLSFAFRFYAYPPLHPGLVRMRLRLPSLPHLDFFPLSFAEIFCRLTSCTTSERGCPGIPFRYERVELNRESGLRTSTLTIVIWLREIERVFRVIISRVENGEHTKSVKRGEYRGNCDGNSMQPGPLLFRNDKWVSHWTSAFARYYSPLEGCW